MDAFEKVGLIAPAPTLAAAPAPRWVRSTRRDVHFGIFGVLVFLAAVFTWLNQVKMARHRDLPSPSSSTPAGAKGYDEDYTLWRDMEPSTELSWRPCFRSLGQPFFCTRLTVPMDYHRPLESSPSAPKVHLALVLLPGQNHTVGATKHCGGRYGSDRESISVGPSPLLINPGGPGGSGAVIVLGRGPQIQQIAGAHHDIIGFDPRGIAGSTPKANCFLYGGDMYSDEDEETPEAGHAGDGFDDGSVPAAMENLALVRRLVYEASRHDVGLVNSSNVALAKNDVHWRAAGRQCAEYDAELGDDSIFKYVGTPNVARDMLSIVHAWDRWTNGTAKSANAASAKMEDTRGKLVYWGFSYGTLLGATYAAMFPDKVGRVILDGVVDADLYVSPTWLESLRDTDYILAKFFDYCVDAGPNCRLYRPGDEPSDVRARYDLIMARLAVEPLHIVHPFAHVPLIVTFSDVKALVFMSFYSPNVVFPAIAMLFDLLIRGVELSPLLVSPMDLVGMVCFVKNLTLPYYPDDGSRGVMCSDKRYKLNDTVPALQERFEKFAAFSDFADVWMEVALSCDGWEIESRDPPMRWDDHPAKSPDPIKTSFPLLFLSNSHDPVTPLYAGLKMATKFVGSGLVEQRSEGHCTIAAVSLCTIAKIRAYLNEAKVPPPPKVGGGVDWDHDLGGGSEVLKGTWDTCEADEVPWKPYPGGLSRVGVTCHDADVDAEKEKLSETELTVDAVRELADHVLASERGPMVANLLKSHSSQGKLDMFLKWPVQLLDEELSDFEEWKERRDRKRRGEVVEDKINI